MGRQLFKPNPLSAIWVSWKSLVGWGFTAAIALLSAHPASTSYY